MIKSFANTAAKRLFRTGQSKYPSGMNARRALIMLRLLDAAPSLQAISPLKSIGLHPLKGDRQSQWAIIVNGPWRICFRFADGDAYDVEIVDYH
jgi:proteic killer suppression protein